MLHHAYEGRRWVHHEPLVTARQWLEEAVTVEPEALWEHPSPLSRGSQGADDKRVLSDNTPGARPIHGWWWREQLHHRVGGLLASHGDPHVDVTLG